MNNKSKALLLLLCAVVVVAAAAFGTLAYLTDKDADTNTFTVGKVGLKLDEAKVNTAGQLLNKDGSVHKESEAEEKLAARVQGNTYHLLPGHTYTKDPTVTMDAKSEKSYVRMIVKVENIDKLKLALPQSGDTAKYYGTDNTFLLQMLCNGWDGNIWEFEKYTEVKAEKDSGATAGSAISAAVGDVGIYEFRYKEVVAKSDAEKKLPALFQSITVPGEIDNAHLDYLDAVKIIVEAHAIQAAGFDTADAAWEAFESQK